MIDITQLKLKEDGCYVDRAHYIMNMQSYIAYWASLPVNINYKPSLFQKLKELIKGK
jgi:hypothetical protein